MELTLNSVMGLAALTLRDPKEGARRVLALRLPSEAVWLAFGLVVVLSVLVLAVVSLLMPTPDAAEAPPLVLSPMIYGAMVAGTVLGISFALTLCGRALGGTGSFPEALTLMVWLEFLFIALRVVQAVLGVTMPALGTLFTLAALGLVLWLIINFIAVLHGFTSLGKAALTLLFAMVGLSLVLSFALTLSGFGVS